MAMRYHSHVRVLKQEMLSCSTHSRPPVHRPDCSELDVPSLVMGKGESLSEWSKDALEIRQKVPQVAQAPEQPFGLTSLSCAACAACTTCQHQCTPPASRLILNHILHVLLHQITSSSGILTHSSSISALIASSDLINSPPRTSPQPPPTCEHPPCISANESKTSPRRRMKRHQTGSALAEHGFAPSDQRHEL